MSAALPAVLLAALYGWGVQRARRTWPWTRTLAAGAACATLAVALGPLDAGADARLSEHMLQHVLVGLLAPLLLALAAPMRLLIAALPPAGLRALMSLLHGRAARQVLRPATAIALAVAVLVVAHLPGAMDAVERHGALHALDHAALFWTGALTWVSLLGVDPVRGSPGPIGLMTALVAWMAPMALLGAFYTGATRVLVAAYAHGSAPLADQHTAGMVMWLGGMAVVAPVAVVATIRGLWAEEQRQRRREQLEALR